MQKVRCYECGKCYNYDGDCFCPNCGAFNQPPRAVQAGASGSVLRVDGINERGHENSFVHQELHEEKRERRRSGLDKSVRRIQRAERAEARDERQNGRNGANFRPLNILVWVICGIVAINILSSMLYIFF